jgi:hypothetical protein
VAKPFDATIKYLVEGFPADWLALAGLGLVERVAAVDANLSTITAEADKVLRVEAPEPWLVHIEFQTSHEANFPRRLLRYNSLLKCVTKLWVEMNERSRFRSSGTYAGKPRTVGA